MIPGYTVVAELHRGRKRVVYRALRVEDGAAVVVKTSTSNPSSERDHAGLRREYDILRSLHIDGVVKVYSLDTRERPALILEDIAGESLRSLVDAHRLDLPTFFPIAIALCQAVGELHRQHVFHRDLAPQNVMVNVATGQLRLIDFGIALRVAVDNPRVRSPHLLEGTLAYIAPEQTGRMNRAADSRADLYSMGVMFYEMLTGQLPFQSEDLLELIHFHIAKIPTPPHTLQPELPRAISDIVMRLLAKNAEDRYQSAFGVKSDLEACAALWKTHGAIDGLVLGEDDFAEEFQVSQKLYGREDETEILIEAFGRVSAGATEMLLVCGHPGIGKSALVHEVHKPIAQQRGYFIAGKFDQYRRNIPYSALIEAFQELIRQLLTESDEAIRVWRDRLCAALGASGQVIVDVIPEVEMIVGPQAPVPVLGAAENQNRFNRLFQDFSAVFAHERHPLVIFLDDLQWADLSTLQLLRTIVANPDSHHLLLVGAYRDNEVDESHPLVAILAEIERQRAITRIALRPLELAHVTELIADSMGIAAELARPLAIVVHDKTAGNPFFVNMFLRSLHQDRLISSDLRRKTWTYDLPRINALDITANVVDLMVSRIRKLSPAGQAMLSLAASIGSSFDTRTLSVISELTPGEVDDALALCTAPGLIRAFDDHEPGRNSLGRFRFLHDRVQQAAYSLIPEGDRPALHHRIGRLLLATLTPEELAESLFAVVDHLNAGAALVTDPGGRRRLAELNLTAARRAKRSLAYEPALRYVVAGMRCLPATSWDDDYELTFAYHLEKGELEYLDAKWNQAIDTFDTALAHSTGVLERGKVSEYKVILYRAKNELRTSLSIAIAALDELGVHLAEPDEAEVEAELQRFHRLVDRDSEELFHLPELTDAKKLLALILLREAMNGAFFVGSRMLFTISMKMVEITVTAGNSPHACVAYMYQAAFTLSGLVGDFATAHRMGKLALRLNEERYRIKPYDAIILNNWGGFISHHTEDVDTARGYLEKGYYIALENGMYQWTGYCAINRMYMSFWGTDTLPEVVQKIDETLPWLKRFDQNMAEYFSAIKATIVNLRQPATDWRLLSEEVWAGSEKVVDTFRERDDFIGLLVNATCRLSLANWYGDDEEAARYADIGERFVVAGPGLYIIPVFHFHKCLAYAAAHERADGDERARLAEKIRSTVPKFQLWAKHSPRTYLHRLLLIEAELARIDGDGLVAIDRYRESIRVAGASGFVQDAALASERCGRFWLGRGDDKIGLLYLAEAYAAYDRWGARGKLVDMDQKSRGGLVIVGGAGGAGGRFDELPMVLSTIARASESLDLTTVLKASQVISSEIVLERLVERLLRIALESAGAQKGVLMLERDGELAVVAEGAVENDEVAVRYGDPRDAGGHATCPQTICNYVRRTGESLVLADAAGEGRFAGDPYIARKNPRSILCMPIVNQGKRIGILYLENHLVVDAFKRDRIRVMQMLCSQAAISLENARFCDEATQEAARRRRLEERERALLEINNAIISNLTRDNLFQAIFTAVGRVVPFDRCAIFLHDPGRDVLRLIALRASGPTVFQVGYEMPATDGNSGWAFSHQAVSRRRDLEGERSHATEHVLYAEGIRSLCAVPLVVRGASVGTLAVLSEAPDRYSEGDGAFLKQVGNQVILAIENMKAYEEIATLKARLEAENVYLKEEIRTEHNFVEIVGHSPALMSMLQRVEQIAPTDATVLILGETGTGKELVARAIHDRSPRRDRPLVKLNCAAISSGLMESEMFGHVKGAFTGAIERRQGRFELADGGTIFLDEIGELPLDAQVKLLRVLQEREFEPVGSNRTVRVDVRIIAATNRNLEEAIGAGRFRSDLFYRLNVVSLRAPALRHRASDIPLLVSFFATRFAKRFGKKIDGVSQPTMAALAQYQWPGNIRELQNVIERSVVLSTEPILTIGPGMLASVSAVDGGDTVGATQARQGSRLPGPTPSSSAGMPLEEVAKQHIRAVLEQTGGVIEGPNGAARILSLHPNTLRSRMKKLGILKVGSP